MAENSKEVDTTLTTSSNDCLRRDPCCSCDGIRAAMEELSQEARELYLSSVPPRLKSAPTPLQFYRDCVCPNRPVIIENLLTDWPALHKWTDSYLIEKLKDSQITVAVTPNGLADSPVGDAFVLPHEETMTMQEFLTTTRRKDRNAVYYIQKQDSNFTSEFSALSDDIALDFPWMSEALNKSPDAINFWMGDEQSVTSMHKDHYENLYAVIKGSKTFTLLPPTDLCHIPHKMYDVARYRRTLDPGGNFEIICDDEQEKRPWISFDPTNPQYTNVTPIVCHVKAGDVLYLPSLWFHHVTQSDKTIAINYWYDMEYDIKFNYFQFLTNIKQHVTSTEN